MVYVDVRERPPNVYFDFDEVFGESPIPHYLSDKDEISKEMLRLFETLDIKDIIDGSLQTMVALTPFQETEVTPLSNLEEFIERGRLYSVIKACCGDDCVTVSDCSAYMPSLIGICEEVLELKISQPDVGNSHRVGAYTQGFILAPLSPMSGFSIVNNYIGQKAVAWTLDLPDAKRYSGIRKQSDEETDFSGKYIYIAQAADWVDPDWVTYDFHQFGKVISMLTLDYRNSRAHPFVFKAEGGCGGYPPWKNVPTAEASFFSFRRGKDHQAILLALDESTKIRKGFLSPTESDYLRLIHQAGSGHIWSSLFYSFQEAKKEGLDNLRVQDMIDQVLGKEQIPQELAEKAVEVFPRSTLVGMMIAQLRNFGFLMTELDVMNYIAKKRKFSALTGVEPLGPIFAKEEVDLALNRRKGNKFILELIEAKSPDKEALQSARRFASDNRAEILLNYYDSHPGHFLSSFVYADGIRIFKSEDVINFVDHDERKLLMESLRLPYVSQTSGLDTAAQVQARMTQVEAFETAKRFISNINLSELNDPISDLPQIGAGDPLVLREAEKQYSLFLQQNLDAERKYVTLIVTEDKFLVFTISQQMSKKYGIPVLYISGRWFLDWIARDPRKGNRLAATSWRSDASISTSTVIRAFGYDRKLSSADISVIREKANLSLGCLFDLSIIFDYANVRRRLGLISRERGMLKNHSHSYVKRSEIQRYSGTASAVALRTIDDLDELLEPPGASNRLAYSGQDSIRVLAAPLAPLVL